MKPRNKKPAPMPGVLRITHDPGYWRAAWLRIGTRAWQIHESVFAHNESRISFQSFASRDGGKTFMPAERAAAHVDPAGTVQWFSPSAAPRLVARYAYLFDWLHEQLHTLPPLEGEAMYAVPDGNEIGARANPRTASNADRTLRAVAAAIYAKKLSLPLVVAVEHGELVRAWNAASSDSVTELLIALCRAEQAGRATPGRKWCKQRRTAHRVWMRAIDQVPIETRYAAWNAGQPVDPVDAVRAAVDCPTLPDLLSAVGARANPTDPPRLIHRGGWWLQTEPLGGNTPAVRWRLLVGNARWFKVEALSGLALLDLVGGLHVTVDDLGFEPALEPEDQRALRVKDQDARRAWLRRAVGLPFFVEVTEAARAAGEVRANPRARKKSR